jgi:hypothetical protein
MEAYFPEAILVFGPFDLPRPGGARPPLTECGAPDRAIARVHDLAICPRLPSFILDALIFIMMDESCQHIVPPLSQNGETGIRAKVTP